ncbi:MAG TPA: hypothetical protein VKM93_21525 [Terriglobia bacterium]|nr:hypothetical protein [Terriglobia bacterium]
MAALFVAVSPAVGYARQGEENWENLKQVQVGQTIEVVDMSLKSLTGTFVSFSDEAISLRNRGGDVTVLRPDVLRVSLREHAKRTRNVLIGAAVGAGAGAAVGIAFRGYCANEAGSCSGIGLAAAGILGGIGAGVGALPRGYRTIYRAERRRGSKTH